MINNKEIIAWFSGGITSAVACKLTALKHQNARIVYIHINSHHEDSIRFKNDCEAWYGKKIETFQSLKYADQFEVIEKTKYVNGANGARCTLELKKKVRERIEKEINFSNQVWGFEFEKKQVNRAIRWMEQYPQTNSLFPLIENKLTKNECAGIIQSAGIEIPEMYKLGYSNNNCIGCVKGGAGYWNKIRVDFPNIFDRMAKTERLIGASCLKNKNGKLFLDELNPSAGNPTEIVTPECGIFCQVEFADLMHNQIDKIMNGELSIYNL